MAVGHGRDLAGLRREVEAYRAQAPPGSPLALGFIGFSACGGDGRTSSVLDEVRAAWVTRGHCHSAFLRGHALPHIHRDSPYKPERGEAETRAALVAGAGRAQAALRPVLCAGAGRRRRERQGGSHGVGPHRAAWASLLSLRISVRGLHFAHDLGQPGAIFVLSRRRRRPARWCSRRSGHPHTFFMQRSSAERNGEDPSTKI